MLVHLSKHMGNKLRILYVLILHILLAFAAAFQESMTESNIKGGFRGAGLVPLNAEGVLSKLNIQLRTPTPPEGLLAYKHLGFQRHQITQLKHLHSHSILKPELHIIKTAPHQQYLKQSIILQRGQGKLCMQLY